LVQFAELRKWLTLIISVGFIIALFFNIKSCDKLSLLETESSTLKKEKEELQQKIDQLKKELESKPNHVEPIIKEKVVTVTKCYAIINNKKQEVPCDSGTEQIEVNITWDDCCKLGMGVEFGNEYIICKDKNVCIKGDESIELTEKGKSAFKDISHSVEQLGERKFFKPALLGGYDFVSSNFVAGFQLINFSNLGFGIDVSSNFKNIKTADAGIFGLYRPGFKGFISNIGLGIGVSTPLGDFGKSVNIQALLMFYAIEKK